LVGLQGQVERFFGQDLGGCGRGLSRDQHSGQVGRGDPAAGQRRLNRQDGGGKIRPGLFGLFG
jgi:hypothetical protein